MLSLLCHYEEISLLTFILVLFTVSQQLQKGLDTVH